MGKFTDRFVVLPAKLFVDVDDNTDIAEKPKEIKIRYRILPYEIEAYHPTIVGEEKAVRVELKSGTGLCIYCTITEFENILNTWKKKRSFNPSRIIKPLWNKMQSLFSGK